MSLRAELYSPLCDSDSELYADFLSTVRHVVTERLSFARSTGGRCVGEMGCGSGRGLGSDSVGVVELSRSVADRLLGSVSDGEMGPTVEASCSRSAGFGQEARVVVEAVEEVAAGIGCVGQSVGSDGVRGGNRVCGDVSTGGGCVEELVASGVSLTTLLNRQRRKARLERKKARQAGMKRDDWRAKQCADGSVFGNARRDTRETQVVPEELRESWIERKKAENRAMTRKFEREMEIMASQDVEKIKKRTNAKLDASLKLAEGQVAGKYSLVAPKHVIGYCETVGTATSSSSGSSGAVKSAWSGSGASKFSRNSSETSREKELEDEIAILKREVAEVKKSAQKNVDEQLKRDLKNACYYLARGGNDAYESFLTIKGKKVLAGFQGNY